MSIGLGAKIGNNMDLTRQDTRSSMPTRKGYVLSIKNIDVVTFYVYIDNILSFLTGGKPCK